VEIEDELWPIANASRDLEVAHFVLGKMNSTQVAIGSPSITRPGRVKVWVLLEGQSSNTLLYASGSKESVTGVTIVLTKEITVIDFSGAQTT
jgi:hypothetical protein